MGWLEGEIIKVAPTVIDARYPGIDWEEMQYLQTDSPWKSCVASNPSTCISPNIMKAFAPVDGYPQDILLIPEVYYSIQR